MTRDSRDALAKVLESIVHGAIDNTKFEGLEGQSGRLIVSIEVCLDRGLIPWSEASVYFRQRRKFLNG